MQGNQALTNPQAQAQSKPFTTLPDLLPTSTTIPVVESLPPKSIDSLLSYLPPTLLLLSQEADDISSVDLKPETAAAALEALSLDQKKDILKKVLRSPQFSQSLGSLTQALRDGGLPSISDALGVKVKNGGFTRRGEMPVGDGEAVEAFLRGVRGSVEEKEQEDEGEKMQTD
jgi:26S proteasome regulatory subunit N13